MNGGKASPCRNEGLTGCVQKTDTAGGSRPAAPIIGRAPAKTHNNPGDTPGSGIQDQLANPESRCFKGILAVTYQRKTCGSSHLNNGRPTLVDQAVERLGLFQERSLDSKADLLASQCRKEGVYRSLAAVGNRDRDDIGMRIMPAYGLFHDPAKALGIHGPLE